MKETPILNTSEADTLLGVFLKLYFMADAVKRRKAISILADQDTNDPLGEKLHTPKEVAQMLNLCEKTVYAACSSGKLRHVRIDSSVRIPASAVREWIEIKQPLSPAGAGGTAKTAVYPNKHKSCGVSLITTNDSPDVKQVM